VLQCRPLLAHAQHVFTSRDVRLREDEQEWTGVAAVVGLDPSRLRFIRQVHGTSVAIVRTQDATPWNRPEADALISDDPDSAICVRVADCAPILLVDTRTNHVGAVHAGWRGAAKGVVAQAVRALSDEFGSRPADLMVAIGPCLGSCCGEVGADVVDAFRLGGHAEDEISRWFRRGRGDRWQLDLPGANRDQLKKQGVRDEFIFDAGLCTRTHSTRFHSYRADGGSAGRMAAVIRKKG
jgi:polyphenol oxidase